MRLSTYSSIVTFIMLGLTICHGDQSDDLYKRYKDTIFSGDISKRYDTSWVTPEMIPVLLQRAQAEYASSSSAQKDFAFSALIELGDPTTIGSYMADYHSGKMDDVMPSLALIPYLAEDVYHGSTDAAPGYVNGDVVIMPASIMDKSTMTMYQILTLYPSFPEGTREWARREMAAARSVQGGPDSRANQLMRQWWEHNKEAVLAHKYAGANWLPSQSQIPLPSAIPAPSTSSIAAQSAHHFSVLDSPIVHEAPDTGLPWWLYRIPILSLGLIGGLWFAWKVKNKR